MEGTTKNLMDNGIKDMYFVGAGGRFSASMYSFFPHILKNLLYLPEKWRKRSQPSIRWFMTQMSTTAQAGPGQSQQSRTLSVSPTWVAGARVLRPVSAAFPGPLVGIKWKVETLGCKLLPIGDAVAWVAI